MHLRWVKGGAEAAGSERSRFHAPSLAVSGRATCHVKMLEGQEMIISRNDEICLYLQSTEKARGARQVSISQPFAEEQGARAWKRR